MRPRRKRWVIVLAGAIILVNVLALGVGIYLQDAATRPSWASDSRKTYAQVFGVTDEELARWFKSERFARLTKQRVSLASHRGETIDGLLVYHDGSVPARGTVVLEGYTYTVMPLGDVFLDRGFNVLIYHERLTRGEIGFGYFEKYDLENVVRLVRQEDSQGTIGVYGSSRGAATALQHAAMREGGDVAFYIIDAAFSDLGDLLRYHYRKDIGLPLDPLVYGYASLVNYLRDGYFLGDASPRRSIAGVRTPMLFIHGRADTVIPYRMTAELYKAKPGVKLLLTHDGGHGLIDIKGGGSIVEHREALERKVDELLALAARGGGSRRAYTVSSSRRFHGTALPRLVHKGSHPETAFINITTGSSPDGEPT